MSSIARQHWFKQSVALKTSAGAAGYTDLPFGDFAAGKVYIPSGSSITTLTFYSSAAAAGRPLPDNTSTGTPTYTQCRDAGNSNLSMTVAAGYNYPLPKELFADGVLQIVADAAGNVDVSFKG